MTTQLTSPVGSYEPQVLMLAPPDGECLNTLSLAAQFIEMGIAIELDENWRLPTAPPKDLSNYRACIFPDHPDVVARYEKDLEAYNQAGGFVPYLRYYPVQTTGGHFGMLRLGRDVFMFTLANLLIEAGVDSPSADFQHTLRSRDVRSMLAEYRAQYMHTQAGAGDKWTNWGDPGYTQLLTNFHLAESLSDDEWLEVAFASADRLCNTVPDFLADHYRFQEIKKPGIVQCNGAFMAEFLMYHGHRYDRADWLDAGIQLGRFYMDHTEKRGHIYQQAYHRQIWSETLHPLPTLIGLSRFDTRSHYRAEADKMLRAIAKTNLTDDGIWLHFTDPDTGAQGLPWSRGNQWGILWPTRALMLMEDHDGDDAAFIIDVSKRAFAGLAKRLDPEAGLLHLVVNEPDTRLESSGTAGLIYCHDRLRELGLIDSTHDADIDRAFQGMKSMWYHGGLACYCRGTATGNPNYYRTRPIGYHKLSLFPAAFGPRINHATINA